MSTVVPGWPVAFRGSRAVAAGLITRGRLRGPGFVRLFPDVYCPAGDEPPDLQLRSLGAYRLIEGRGVLAGYSAAVLLDADCAPHHDVPAEVMVAGGGQRVHDGLLVRRDRITPGETVRVGDVRCTSPVRTAYDLGRQDDLVEAVVAVDRPKRVLWINAAAKQGGNLQVELLPTGTVSTRTCCCTSPPATAATPAPPGCPPCSPTPTPTPARPWRPACG